MAGKWEKGDFMLTPKCGAESLGKHGATQGVYKSVGHGKIRTKWPGRLFDFGVEEERKLF